jgi:hypothetical protein
MPLNTVWSDVSTLPNVFTFLHQTDLGNRNLNLDGIAGEWRFEIAPRKGRLYVNLGTKTQNDTPIIVMTLIARGSISEDSLTLDAGLELGHAIVIDAFDCLTSTEAQKVWGVQR